MNILLREFLLEFMLLILLSTSMAPFPGDYQAQISDVDADNGTVQKQWTRT